MNEQRPINVVIAGRACVGKTSLLKRYREGSFDEIYSTTIGLCIETQEIQNGEERFKVNYWDTGGDYLFPCRLPVFIRKCDAVIVVNAADNCCSLSQIDEWKCVLQENIKDPQTVLVFVVTKCDVKRLTDSQLTKLATIGGFNLWFQTSAKSGENVNLVFEETIDAVIANRKKQQIDMGEQKRRKFECCCLL
ncbi:ras-related protein Rab-7L1-like [Convolutriloba macropyga]|uniref:ras-related protein Rab-7L1-like n=1 Tax=Convolutriloba macropyga TaxID=536237 RepID=UPI003F524CDE